MTALNGQDAPNKRINGIIFRGKATMPYVSMEPSSPRYGDGKSQKPTITPIIFKKEANHELKIMIFNTLQNGMGFLQ